jgi:hypothetical protein
VTGANTGTTFAHPVINSNIGTNWQSFVVPNKGIYVALCRFYGELQGLFFCCAIHVDAFQAGAISMKSVLVWFHDYRD